MTALEAAHGHHVDRTALRGCLLDDHRQIEASGLRVAACVDADDPHGALEEWPAFENGLLAHMNAEEMLVLPRFAEVDPEAAELLRVEHAALRAELGQLGLLLELHAARKPMFDALVARLARHAEREDELMYTWADRSLPERVRDAVVRRIIHAR